MDVGTVGGLARWFTIAEPDECLERLQVATTRPLDAAALQSGEVEEIGWRPQLKDKGSYLRLRPPRKLGGVLTLVTLRVSLRRDDGGGTIVEVRRRRPLWTWLVAAPPFLLGLILCIVAASGLWGVLVVAAVALALGALLPNLLLRVGDPDVLRLARFIGVTLDAVPMDDDPDDAFLLDPGSD